MESLKFVNPDGYDNRPLQNSRDSKEIEEPLFLVSQCF
jgi:hypothetical protein